jgi:hypothetical protein
MKITGYYKEYYMDNKYKIDCMAHKDGKIEQIIKYETWEMVHIISRSIIDTKEKETRQALIALGWTPPQKDKNDN